MTITSQQLAELRSPFRWSELEHRQQGKASTKGNVQVLTYVQRKAIIDRLDAVLGPENWQDTYEVWTGDKSAKCRLSIRIGDTWVHREDAAEETDIEAVKGGVTGAFKRAASKWGVGLYLYDFPTVWLAGRKVGEKIYLPDDTDKQVLAIVKRDAPHLLHPADAGQRASKSEPAPQPEKKGLLMPSSPGFTPAWTDEPLDAGKYQGHKWGFFLEPSESGGRIGYLEWLITSQPDSDWAKKASLCYMYRCTQRWYEPKLRDGRPITAINVVQLCAEKGLKP